MDTRKFRSVLAAFGLVVMLVSPANPADASVTQYVNISLAGGIEEGVSFDSDAGPVNRFVIFGGRSTGISHTSGSPATPSYGSGGDLQLYYDVDGSNWTDSRYVLCSLSVPSIADFTIKPDLSSARLSLRCLGEVNEYYYNPDLWGWDIGVTRTVPMTAEAVWTATGPLVQYGSTRSGRDARADVTITVGGSQAFAATGLDAALWKERTVSINKD